MQENVTLGTLQMCTSVKWVSTCVMCGEPVGDVLRTNEPLQHTRLSSFLSCCVL